MQTVAIIPARGGSKRIPRKNIRPFLGRPIIAYSIDAARTSGLFDRIIVSTDCAEIAGVAREFGAETPFLRSADLADDHTGSLEVVRDAIERLGPNRVGLACCIYATAPLLRAADLKRGHLAVVCSDVHHYAFAVASFGFPVQRALKIDACGSVQPLHPEHRQTRSQDLEETWHDAGQFYWGRAHAFVERIPLYSVHAAAIRVPRHLVQDIDTEEDWARAELLYQVAERQKVA